MAPVNVTKCFKCFRLLTDGICSHHSDLFQVWPKCQDCIIELPFSYEVEPLQCHKCGQPYRNPYISRPDVRQEQIADHRDQSSAHPTQPRVHDRHPRERYKQHTGARSSGRRSRSPPSGRSYGHSSRKRTRSQTRSQHDDEDNANPSSSKHIKSRHAEDDSYASSSRHQGSRHARPSQQTYQNKMTSLGAVGGGQHGPVGQQRGGIPLGPQGFISNAPNNRHANQAGQQWNANVAGKPIPTGPRALSNVPLASRVAPRPAPQYTPRGAGQGYPGYHGSGQAQTPQSFPSSKKKKTIPHIDKVDLSIPMDEIKARDMFTGRDKSSLRTLTEMFGAMKLIQDSVDAHLTPEWKEGRKEFTHDTPGEYKDRVWKGFKDSLNNIMSNFLDNIKQLVKEVLNDALRVLTKMMLIPDGDNPTFDIGSIRQYIPRRRETELLQKGEAMIERMRELHELYSEIVKVRTKESLDEVVRMYGISPSRAASIKLLRKAHDLELDETYPWPTVQFKEANPNGSIIKTSPSVEPKVNSTDALVDGVATPIPIKTKTEEPEDNPSTKPEKEEEETAPLFKQEEPDEQPLVNMNVAPAVLDEKDSDIASKVE